MSKDQKAGQSGAEAALLVKRALIAGFACVAFLMTLYATNRGASSFLPEAYASLGITALAVGFLLFTSFVIGEGITKRRPAYALAATPFYLAAVVICWIFSFASYHAQFLTNAGADLADAENKLGEMLTIVRPLDSSAEQILSSARKSLTDSDAFEAYVAEIERLARSIGDAGRRDELSRRISEEAEARRRTLTEQREEAFRKRRDAQDELERVVAEIESQKARIVREEAAAAEAGESIAALEAALEEEVGEAPRAGAPPARLPADGAAARLVDAPACRKERFEGTGGVGTCFAALSQQLETVRARLESSRQAERDAKGRIDEAEFAVVAARSAAEAAEIEFERLPAAQDSAGLSVPSEKTLAENASRLRVEPTPQNFEAVAAECETVAAALQQIDAQGPGAECRPQALISAFSDLGKAEATRAGQASACAVEEKAKGVVASLRAQLETPGGEGRSRALVQAFDDMRATVLTPCIEAAEAAGVDASGVRADLAGFIDRNNPSQDEISKATGKIRDLFTGSASARDYFPALIAILQELSLLAAKLFWDGASVAPAPARRGRDDDDLSPFDVSPREGDSGPLAAVKNVVRLASHDRKGLLLPEDYDDGYSPEVRGQMAALLGSLQRRGHAAKGRDGIRIHREGVAEIAAILRRHEAGAAATSEAGSAENADDRIRRGAGRGGPALKVVSGRRGGPAPLDAPSVPDRSVDGGTEPPRETGRDGQGRRQTRRPVIVRPFDD